MTGELLRENRETLSRMVRWLNGHAFQQMQNWLAERGKGNIFGVFYLPPFVSSIIYV